MATVNYDDERFQQVTREQNAAIEKVQNTYNNMINKTQQYYNEQAKAAEDYGKKQAQIQQQNTDFAIEKIEQQKDQANKDYVKEQKGAYVDWQKQSNKYGVQAEQQASAGLRNGGYAESSQVSMYNQYQNRVATAKESYDRAVLEYNNGIKEAQLTNNAELAKIAYQALQTKLEINLKGFESGNQLLLSQINALNAEKDRYYSRWQDVLKQINYENELAEQQKQYEEQMALQRQANNYKYGGGSGGSYLSDNGSIDLSGNASLGADNNAKNAAQALGGGASAVYNSIKIDGKTYKPSNKVVVGNDGYNYMLYTYGKKQYVYRNGKMIEYSGTTSGAGKSNGKNNGKTSKVAGTAKSATKATAKNAAISTVANAFLPGSGIIANTAKSLYNLFK